MHKRLFLHLIALFICFSFFTLKADADAHVVINEFVAHPSSGNSEWVEFYNPDEIDLTNYWIDDDTDFNSDIGSSSKKSLSTLKEGKDANHQFIELSSMFNNSGDNVVLFDNTGNIVDKYEYTKDPGSDVTIGRAPDGTGDFKLLASASQGDINSSPLPSVTPTPTKMPTPIKTPTPTKSPTPTYTPTPTRSPTSTRTPSTYMQMRNSAINPTNTTYIADQTEGGLSEDEASISAGPTSILGVSTKSPEPTNSSKKESRVLVKDATKKTNASLAIAVIFGAICFIACGILVYWKMRSSKQEL